MDVGGAFVAVTDNTSTSTWNKLGLQAPGTSVTFGPGAKFDYTCASPSCTASRTVNGTASTVVLNSSTLAWTCSGLYTALSNGGCTVGGAGGGRYSEP